MPQHTLEGPKWHNAAVSWSFAAQTFANDATAAFSNPIGGVYQDVVRSAFARWTSVSGLAAQEVVDGADAAHSANIRIGFGALGTGSTGVTSYRSTGYPGGLQAFFGSVIVRLEDPSESAVFHRHGARCGNARSNPGAGAGAHA